MLLYVQKLRTLDSSLSQLQERVVSLTEENRELQEVVASLSEAHETRTEASGTESELVHRKTPSIHSDLSDAESDSPEHVQVGCVSTLLWHLALVVAPGYGCVSTCCGTRLWVCDLLLRVVISEHFFFWHHLLLHQRTHCGTGVLALGGGLSEHLCHLYDTCQSFKAASVAPVEGSKCTEELYYRIYVEEDKANDILEPLSSRCVLYRQCQDP